MRHRVLAGIALLLIFAVLSAGCSPPETVENDLATPAQSPTTADSGEPVDDAAPPTPGESPAVPRPGDPPSVADVSMLRFIPENAYFAMRILPGRMSESKTYQSLPKDATKLLGGTDMEYEAKMAREQLESNSMVELLAIVAGTGPDDSNSITVTTFVDEEHAAEALATSTEYLDNLREESHGGASLFVYIPERDVVYQESLCEGSDRDPAALKKQLEDDGFTNVEVKIVPDEFSDDGEMIVAYADPFVQPRAFWRPSEKIVVEGAPELLKAAIDNSFKSGLVREKLSALGDDNTVAGVLFVEPIREAIKAEQEKEGRLNPVPPPLLAAMKLVDDCNYVTLTGDLDADPLLTVVADCPSPESAKRVTDEVTSQIALLKVLWAGLKQEMADEMKLVLASVIEVGDDGIAGIETTAEGATAKVVLNRPKGLDTMGETIAQLMEVMRPAMQREEQKNALKQVMLSFHNFHDTRNHFPANEVAENGVAPHLSWRYGVLPYLEQLNLYDAIDRTKSWDDPANQAEPLGDFNFPYGEAPEGVKPGHTVFLSFSGKGTILDGEQKTFASVSDGASNTIAVIIVSPEKAVPWLSPRDIDFTAEDLLAEIGPPPTDEGWPAGFFDGHVELIPADTSADRWRKLIGINNDVAGTPE